MLDLILGILWLIVAGLVFIEKRDMVVHVENVALIYVFASAFFFSRYIYFRQKARRQRKDAANKTK